MARVRPQRLGGKKRPGDIDESVKSSRCRPQKHMVRGAGVLSFPPFAFVGIECSNSSPGRFTQGERAPVYIHGRGLTENRTEMPERRR